MRLGESQVRWTSSGMFFGFGDVDECAGGVDCALVADPVVRAALPGVAATLDIRPTVK